MKVSKVIEQLEILKNLVGDCEIYADYGYIYVHLNCKLRQDVIEKITELDISPVYCDNNITLSF